MVGPDDLVGQEKIGALMRNRASEVGRSMVEDKGSTFMILEIRFSCGVLLCI